MRVRGERLRDKRVLNNSPFPKFQKAWLWYMGCGSPIFLDRRAWPSRSHLPLRHIPHGQGKAGCQKFASLQEQYKIQEWYLDKSWLEKTDSFRSPNQALLNRVNSEQFLQAWKGSLGAGRNDGEI